MSEDQTARGEEQIPPEDRPGEPGAAPEDRPEEPGAEGGSESPEADRLPMTPAPGADSALGDTDQHSEA